MDLLAIAAIITAIVAVINSFTQGRKTRTDEASAINQNYKNLVDDYQRRLEELKGDNQNLSERIKQLEEKSLENKKKMTNLESQLWQALERISVLEGENASLRGEDN
jgi:predicted RNase H-like nuclease (RuvC/YqgF family)